MSCPPTSTMTCGVLVELHRRFGVRDGLDQRDIGLQHVFQHVLRVAGRAHAEHFERRALRLHLLTQMRRTCRWCPGSDCRSKADTPCTARRPLRTSSTALVEVDPPSRPRSRGPSRRAEVAGLNFGRCILLELCQFLIATRSGRRARLRLLRLASDGDVVAPGTRCPCRCRLRAPHPCRTRPRRAPRSTARSPAP